METTYQSIKVELESTNVKLIEKKEHPSFRKLNYGVVLLLSVSLFIFALTLSSKQQVNLRYISPTNKLKIVSHAESPSALWGSVSKPFPTGAFWTNLVVKNGDGPISTIPYGVKCLETGIQISYGASRRIVTQLAITDPFVTDIQVSATQAYLGRSIDSYDNCSVTMSFRTAGNGKYRTHLVKGSPFITVVYEGTTPIISSNLMQITSVEAKVVKASVGVQYIVTLGNNQKWLVYCSEPVAFSWKENTLTAPSAIRGIVRVAILPLQNLDAAFNYMLNYIQKYPTGVILSINYPTGSTAQITYQYLTAGTGPLLMFALPHHMQSLIYPDNDESRAGQAALSPIYSMKGRLKAVVGELWRMQINLVNVGWNYALADKLSNAQLDSIANWLQQEVKWIIPSAQDPYGFGKEVARMARLALIADNLGIADARQQAIVNMENSLNPWLQGTNADPLLYDRTWGGVIPLRGSQDSSADFGSGWYADHHFHYGYFVYAFATLARLDVPYWDARKGTMEMLVKDICGYDPNDPDFPLARHKDFFDGHSWASGLFQQANGKGQESSSEVRK